MSCRPFDLNSAAEIVSVGCTLADGYMTMVRLPEVMGPGPTRAADTLEAVGGRDMKVLDEAALQVLHGDTS